jgi:ABC-type branched-subunit amino acid transport system substrate-binding protein
MKGWKLRAIAAALAVSMLAAACGDDDEADGGETTETTEATDTSEAADGGESTETTEAAEGDGGEAAAGECEDGAEPIKIGALTQAQNYAGLDEGINAVINRVNETCIGGRPLEFVGLEDDGSDPQRNLELARKLVEQDGVFAIVATSAVLLPATTDYLAEQGIPYFGWGFMPGFCGEGSTGYGFNGCLSAYALGLSDNGATSLYEPFAEITGKSTDELTYVILNSDDDAGRFGDILYQDLFPEEQVLAKEFVPATGAADVTQYVNLVLEENPDVTILSVDFATGITLKAALAQAGYEGVVSDYTTYVPGLLEASPDTAAALEGGYSITQLPPNEDFSEASQQIAADLEAAGSELPFATFGALIGYWSTDLMVQMLQAVAAEGEITSENFFAVIEEGGFTSETVDGGLGAVTFPENHFEGVPCSAAVQVLDGAFASAVPFTCYENRPLR